MKLNGKSQLLLLGLGSVVLLRRRKALALAFVLLALGIGESQANILTFTHEGNGSGTLGDDPFPASDFVIRAVVNTDDRVSLSLGSGWSIKHSSASIVIDGLGEFDFLTGTGTFVNNKPRSGESIVGFSRAQGSDLFNGPRNAAFDTWDMLSPIGPITGSGYLFQWSSFFPPVNTTGGILVFDLTDPVLNVSFTATPEASTLLLLGLGSMALLRGRK